MTPDQFREHIKGFAHALAFKFDMPMEALQGAKQRDAHMLLHETTAAIEHQAKSLGFDRACGYSSGGCKNTFCHDYADCAALQNPLRDGRQLARAGKIAWLDDAEERTWSPTSKRRDRYDGRAGAP